MTWLSLTTNPNHPQLWLINAGDIPTEVDLPPVEQLHSTAIKRFKHFGSPHRKHIFLLSRWLIKTAFSSYLAKELSYQQIIEQPFCKPTITSISETIHYSLSHSNNMIGLIIDSAPVGIDIEFKKKRPNAQLMAKEFMSNDELTFYTTTKQLTDFYRIWCCKEAYYKALPKPQQHTFRFKELDTFSIEKKDKQQFFDFSLANYQICSFHQLAGSEISVYQLNSQMIFNNCKKP